MSKPVRVFPFSPFNSRTGAGLYGVSYGAGTSILPPSPPTVGCKDVDAFNVYVTKDGEHERLYRRPGAFQIYNFTPSGGENGVPLGLTFFNGTPFAVVQDSIVGDTLIFPPGQPNSGTDGTAWTLGSTGPWFPRSQAQLVTLNNIIYLLGGFSSSTTSQDVWYANDPASGWAQVSGATPYGPRVNYGTAVFNQTMFVWGGQNGGTLLNDVWSSTDGAAWTQILASAPWSSRASFGVITTPQGIFMLGGNSLSGNSNEVWFTTDGVTWSQVKNSGAIWSVRNSPLCWWFNNTMYVGGGTGSSLAMNDVWSSTNNGISWTQLTAAAWPSGLLQTGTCVYNNRLWAFGGLNNALVAQSAIYTSTNGVSWSNIGTMPQGATAGVGVIVQRTPTSASPQQYNSIWLVGGGPNSGALTNTTYYGNLNTALINQYPLASPVQGTPYDFASYGGSTQLLIKSSTALFIADQGGVRRVFDRNYPFVTARGVVVLGGFVHVMDIAGIIHSCALNFPDQWPALNVLGSFYDDAQGVAISKVLNYLVAWSQYGMEVYYDAGNSEGSPLLPYLAASVEIGCYSGATVINTNKTVIWLGQNRQGLRQVYTLDGLTPRVISTPNIDKQLAAGLPPTQYAADYVYFGGHEFYLLTQQSSHITWVYDIGSQQWTRWGWAPQAGNGSGDHFPTYGSASNLSNTGQGSFFIDANCRVSSMGTLNTDLGSNYYVVIQTQQFDGGNDFNKYWGPLTVVGDRNPGTPSIFFSDDDYTTWGPAHTVDMSTNRPTATRNGRSRRRAITYIQLDTNDIALEYFEFPNVEQGGDAGG